MIERLRLKLAQLLYPKLMREADRAEQFARAVEDWADDQTEDIPPHEVMYIKTDYAELYTLIRMYELRRGK